MIDIFHELLSVIKDFYETSLSNGFLYDLGNLLVIMGVIYSSDKKQR